MKSYLPFLMVFLPSMGSRTGSRDSSIFSINTQSPLLTADSMRSKYLKIFRVRVPLSREVFGKRVRVSSKGQSCKPLRYGSLVPSLNELTYSLDMKMP